MVPFAATVFAMNSHSPFRRAVLALLVFPTVAAAYNPALAPSARADAAFDDLGSKPEALDYLQEQARQNNPTALFYLGVASELGRGMAKNPQVAFDYYRTAADRLKVAAFNAGRLLYLGKQIDDAMSYFVVAAGAERADGLEKAMVVLGRIYERGESNFGRNYIAAARWYEAAARRKDAFAIGKMGEFLLFGLGRPVNKRDARIYIERAADMWNSDAQFLMGEIFSKGLIGPINRTEAGKWYLVAGSHSADQKRRGEAFLSGLTEQEMLSARRMADLWISAHSKVAAVDYLGLFDEVK